MVIEGVILTEWFAAYGACVSLSDHDASRCFNLECLLRVLYVLYNVHIKTMAKQMDLEFAVIICPELAQVATQMFVDMRWLG
jgi:hypothetical protein